MRNACVLLLSGALLASISGAHAQEVDWKQVDTAFGRTAGAVAGDVHRYGFPRTDLSVMLDGVAIKPALALGGWIAFQAAGDGAIVMGDLVLTPEEVNPVMSALLAGGMKVTAIHNHLLRSVPMTLYMHIEGRGDPVKLAAALHADLSLSRTPFGPAAPPSAAPVPGLDVAVIDRALGAKGKLNGGVLQYAIPRKEPIRDGDMAVPPSMGAAISINFQSAGAGSANRAQGWPNQPQRPTCARRSNGHCQH